MLNFYFQCIYFGSYLAIPLFLYICWKLYNRKRNPSNNLRSLISTVILLVITTLFIYARFIEPSLLIVKQSKIQTGFSARVAVISDIHLGAYKDVDYLNTIVERIRTLENIDFVVIPGDFTFYPTQNLDTLFAPLRNISVPVYAVLGNHDSEAPGPKLQEPLQKALENAGVILLNNTGSSFAPKNIRILGLGDFWANQADVSQVYHYLPTENVIAIAHNPDTMMNYPKNTPDITISGHTHGGQIRIPFLYKKVIPSEYGFDEGYYETENGKVYVSAGVGYVGLPLRFLIPPRIDVLEFY